jgi:cytoskeletal protein CcmA (bactofilin family)
VSLFKRRKVEAAPEPPKALAERSSAASSSASATGHDDEVEVDLDDVGLEAHSAATSLPSAVSVIGEDMEVRGPITTASALHISGEVTGDITAGDEVIIERSGQVAGKIQATRVIVRGRVRGPVASSGRLVIEASGVVHGDVVARSLHIDDGGQLQGRCSMKTD